MSRRHHGRPHHARNRTDAARPTGPAGPDGAPGSTIAPTPDARRAILTGSIDGVARAAEPVADPRGSGPSILPGERIAARAVAPPAPVVDPRPADPSSAAPLPTSESGPARDAAFDHAQATSNGCTAPQLRRFIKSRPYVPMHELRRRFGIAGTDDDVTQVRLERQAIYVGLPEREGALLGDLLRGGEIGCELSLDPRTPVVIGVYPMRPVPRG